MNYLKTIYNEKNIVVIGFSLGTAPASIIASKNNPKFVSILSNTAGQNYEELVRLHPELVQRLPQSIFLHIWALLRYFSARFYQKGQEKD